jgi:transcriptional regulator with XRE-family HTH domain
MSTTLKEMLKARGMTVKELSRLTGINLRVLYSYTSGYRKLSLAAAETLQKIADALEIEPRELIK